MATAEKFIGNWNSKLRIVAVRVGQSGANGSTVDVTVDMYNGGTATATNQSGTNWSLSGDVSKGNASFTFSIGPKKWGRVGTHRAVVQHDSSGNKTAKITVNVGNTSTSTFGTPGSLTVSLPLPRIPKAPAKPGKPSVSGATSNSYRASVKAPNNNGAAINQYEWDAGGSTFTTSGTSVTITGRNANAEHRVRVRARNSVGWGAWSDYSAWITTAPVAPAAPTGVGVSRTSDSRHTISWTRRATTAAPYATIRVLRRVYSGSWSGWVQVASIAGTATSYVDTTTVANRSYEYQARAVNAGGTATSASSVTVRTTPAAPSGFKAVKRGQSITVTWTPNQPYSPVDFEIQDNPGGTGWVTVATVGNVATWTHSNPNASVTHQYRGRVKNTGYATLYSSWSSASPVVQLLAPPLAPTLLGPSGTLDKDEPIVFRWQHNAVDTTEQEWYELRYRFNGGAWVNLSGPSAVDSRFYPALGESGSIEWQVRTRGEFPTFGPYSSVAAFTLATPPSVAINAPEPGLYDASRVDVVWGYYQEEGDPQASWLVRLLDADGGVIETRQGSNQAETVSLQSTLRDDAGYTITVEVTASNGLKAVDEVTITTNFPLPVTVEPYVTFDRQTGSASITFGDPPIPEPNETMPEVLDLQRRIGEEGEWVTLATGLALDDAVTDPLPDLVQPNYYRTISRTSLPTEALGEPVELTINEPQWLYFNHGPGFGLVDRLMGNPEVSQEMGRNSAVHPMAGVSFPTSVRGSLLTASYAVSGAITPDSSQRVDWESLAFTDDIICYRDPAGRRVFGNIGLPTFAGTTLQTVELDFERTHFIEGLIDDSTIEQEA